MLTSKQKQGLEQKSRCGNQFKRLMSFSQAKKKKSVCILQESNKQDLKFQKSCMCEYDKNALFISFDIFIYYKASYLR